MVPWLPRRAAGAHGTRPRRPPGRGARHLAGLTALGRQTELAAERIPLAEAEQRPARWGCPGWRARPPWRRKQRDTASHLECLDCAGDLADHQGRADANPRLERASDGVGVDMAMAVPPWLGAAW